MSIRRPDHARWLAAALTLFALVVTASDAHAINLKTTDGVSHDSTAHEDANKDTYLSFADCSAPTSFTFKLEAATASGQVLVRGSATGATACNSQDNVNSGSCIDITSANADSQGDLTVTLSSADIAALISTVSGCTDTNSNTGGTTVSIYFIDGTSDGADSTTAYDIAVDLLGPPPPTGVTAGISDETSLLVSWTPPSDSSDLQSGGGFKIYCVTAPDAQGSDGSGGSGTGGSGTGAGGSGGTGGTGTGGEGGAGGAGVGGAGGAGVGGAGGAGVGGAGGAGVGGAGGAGAGGAGGAGVGGAGGSGTGGTDVGGSDVGGSDVGGSDVGGAGGSTTSSSSSDGGGGSSSSSSTCSDSTVTPGELLGAGVTECGSVTGSVTTSTTVAVQPNTETLVIVASFDKHGNTGVLSNTACGTPEPVTDFFEWYKLWGGEAGGGFCNCAVVGARNRHEPIALFLLFAAAGIALMRRRRA